MGYTNYYRVPVKMDEKKFKTLSEELSTATGFLAGHFSSASGNYYKDSKTAVLFGWDGTGEPEFTSEEIAFNGDESKGLDHESFVINRDNTERAQSRGSENGLVFDFCKTARKPYDLMVQISMLRLKHHFPESKISSDGDSKDWANGNKLYKKIFGEEPPKLER